MKKMALIILDPPAPGPFVIYNAATNKTVKNVFRVMAAEEVEKLIKPGEKVDQIIDESQLIYLKRRGPMITLDEVEKQMNSSGVSLHLRRFAKEAYLRLHDKGVANFGETFEGLWGEGNGPSFQRR